MIATWHNSDGSEVRIVARGNFSLGAGGLVNLLLALAVVTLSLAALVAWQGYWPVLLIAVIQVVLVTWILIKAWQRAWVSDMIDIGPDRIIVVRQRHKRRNRVELPTAWAVVELKPSQIAWYSPMLKLRSGSREVELGRFLTADEKQQLTEHLQNAIRRHSAMKGALKF